MKNRFFGLPKPHAPRQFAAPLPYIIGVTRPNPASTEMQFRQSKIPKSFLISLADDIFETLNL